MATELQGASALALQQEITETRAELVSDLNELQAVLRARLSPMALARAHPSWILGLGLLLAGASALAFSLLLRRR